VKKYAILFLVLAIVVAVLGYRHRHAHPSSSVTVGSFRVTDGVLMPNPELTPGDVRTTDTDEVCNEHTREYRDTSESLKLEVYREYGVEPHHGVCTDTTRMTKGSRRHPPHEVTESCEVDHLVSLELGGADTERNLWPQPYNPVNGLGAHAKDLVENYLHHRVCIERNISLQDAQRAIATDWYKVYKDANLGHDNPHYR
jgi:hypothetical protein